MKVQYAGYDCRSPSNVFDRVSVTFRTDCDAYIALYIVSLRYCHAFIYDRMCRNDCHLTLDTL